EPLDIPPDRVAFGVSDFQSLFTLLVRTADPLLTIIVPDHETFTEADSSNRKLNAAELAAQVTVAFDGFDERDRAILELRPSVQLLAITEAFQWLPQKRMVELVRDELFDSVSADLLPALRQVDFAADARSQSDVRHGGDSLGRSVHREVKSRAGEIPEVVHAEIRFWRNRELPGAFSIPLTLDINHDHQKFRLVPRGDVLALALQSSAEEIREILLAGMSQDDASERVFVR
ncbi:MAG: hypothetical protein AAFP90_16785, partial [Planctomycetota bacterium]